MHSHTSIITGQYKKSIYKIKIDTGIRI